MLTDDARDLLQGGSALIVGLTHPSGMPHATRGYGLDIAPSSSDAVLLMSAAEAEAFGLHPGTDPVIPIAITAADVRTLTSVQVKGTLVAVEDATDADRARKDRYCDDFCGAIQEVDGISPELAARWRPTSVVRCRVTLDQLFLQTPGPGAGAALGPIR